MLSELTILLGGIIDRGLLFALPTVSVYLSARIINFDDLTMEGSFGVGSAVTAVCLVHGFHWSLCIFMAALAGAACGSITCLLHTQLNINRLISGIITTTGLFSVILALAGPFLSIGKHETIFSLTQSLPPLVRGITILFPVVMAIILALRYLLKTQIGFMLRAFGANPHMLALVGKNENVYLAVCLALANAITAIAGSLFVQYAGYFSIWSQVGILIVALSGLMLSEIITSTYCTMLITGPIIYQALLSLTFELQLDPTWNKLVTALLMITLFGIQKMLSSKGSL